MDFAKRIERVIRTFIGVDLDKEAHIDVKPAPEETDEERKTRLAKEKVEKEEEEKNSPVDEDDGVLSHDEL